MAFGECKKETNETRDVYDGRRPNIAVGKYYRITPGKTLVLSVDCESVASYRVSCFKQTVATATNIRQND